MSLRDLVITAALALSWFVAAWAWWRIRRVTDRLGVETQRRAAAEAVTGRAVTRTAVEAADDKAALFDELRSDAEARQ